MSGSPARPDSSSAEGTAGTHRGRITAREFSIFAGSLLLLALALSVFTLVTHPAVHPDEYWYANLAQNWKVSGRAWTTLDAGPFPGGQGLTTTRLGAVPARLAIEIWGVDLRGLRLMSLLAGVASLLAVAAVGGLLWDWRGAVAAALMLALQPLFLAGSHVHRPEVWVLLGSTGALACSLLGWRLKRPAWDALAALLAVATVEIHQNGAVFALALAASYPARYGRSVWRNRSAQAFAVVAAIGAAWYARSAFLAAEGPDGGLKTLGVRSSHSIPLLSDSPVIWPFRELSRYGAHFSSDGLGLLLFALAFTFAAQCRSREDRLLLGWLLGAALAMMLLVSRVFDLYLLPMLGVACVLLGRAWLELLHTGGEWGRRAAVAVVTVLLVQQVGTAAATIARDPLALQSELQEAVPCTRVMGPNEYGFAFTGCDYRSLDLVAHYHHVRGYSVAQAMAAVRPQYLLLDETIGPKLQDGFATGGDMFGYYAMPAAEFKAFLEERATLVRIVTRSRHAPIEVWAVKW